MGLRLVNTAPGDVTTPFKPSQPITMGLRSEGSSIVMGSTNVQLAYSNIKFNGILPENDLDLVKHGASVAFRSVERRQPVSGAIVPAIVGGSLRLPKTDDSDYNNCIYEVSVPVVPGDSVLGYFKFRLHPSWTRFVPDWFLNVYAVGMYFGLECGPFNTAFYSFLGTDGANGSIVTGGPLDHFVNPEMDPPFFRPGQVATPWPWLSKPDDTVVEIYLLFNTYTNPFQVELWAKFPTDARPQILRTTSLSSIGNFRSSAGWANSRPGPSNQATLFFGNAGRTGDLLQIDDWAIYPDFRRAVYQGEPMTRTKLWVRPDSPSFYRASENVPPDESVPGRWLPLGSPSSSMNYQPGRRSQAAYVNIPKETVGYVGYQKNEPRFEDGLDGVMIEAFMAVETIAAAGDAVGGGIGFEDGSQSFRLVAIDSLMLNRRTFAIVKDDTLLADFSNGYHVPSSDFDWSTLKLVRLVLDRHRGEIRAYCVDEDTPILIISDSSTIPNSISPTGRVMVGNLISLGAVASTKIAQLTYLNRYLAWEKEDNKLPSDVTIDPEAIFTENISNDATGSSVTDSSGFHLNKAAVAVSSSYRYYSNAVEITDRHGLLVDFRMKFEIYTGPTGHVFDSNINLGAGVTINTGNKKLVLTFLDCGVYGKKIGIIPGSGSVDDLIKQTALGRAFSGSVEWGEMTSYRLVIRPYDVIELRHTTVLAEPIISIPWRNDTDGFDLPQDVEASAISFGHFEELTSTKSTWEHIRWGMSNGYDIAVQPTFPDGIGPTIFGGRALVTSEFDES